MQIHCMYASLRCNGRLGVSGILSACMFLRYTRRVRSDTTGLEPRALYSIIDFLVRTITYICFGAACDRAGGSLPSERTSERASNTHTYTHTHTHTHTHSHAHTHTFTHTHTQIYRHTYTHSLNHVLTDRCQTAT